MRHDQYAGAALLGGPAPSNRSSWGSISNAVAGLAYTAASDIM